MKTIVISTQNVLLSDAILMSLHRNTDLRAERVLKERLSDLPAICDASGADILLMEVGWVQPFSAAERMAAAADVHRRLPHCRIALLCDEQADPDLAELVKNAKRDGQIDAFFYTSVSVEYLAAMLDAM